MWRTRKPDGMRLRMRASVAAVGLALGLAVSLAMTPIASAASPGDWTTLGYDIGHSGYNGSETAINPTSAHSLKWVWTHSAAGVIVSQPVVTGNLVYWGSWDGYEHATNATNGAFVWSRYLGTTISSCGSTATPFGRLATGAKLGVTATATVTTIGSRAMLIVSGGARQVFALNPTTGAIIWQRTVASNPNAFLWSSPVVFNGHVYIGIASIGDCPLVQGQVVELDGATGVFLHSFKAMPSGCIGAGIWGTPTADSAAGTIYVTTGNPSSCSAGAPYAESIVELRASDLSVVHSWKVPASQATSDGDFGATPTLFTATISGTTRRLVGAANKNGIFYAWDRANISAGPVWERKVAVAGSCPGCGQGSIAPAAWDGSQLYVAGGNTTINGQSCQGSVRALNPANGAPIWQHCLLSGPVLGPVTAVKGVVAATQGNWLIVMGAATGPTLFRFADSSGQRFLGGASISNGYLYVDNSDGHLFAFKA